MRLIRETYMEAPFTREFLLKHFYYCNLTGNLIWKSHWAGNKQYLINKIAGSIKKDGNIFYRDIIFNYKHYTVHRLIYFLETGKWPKTIDHIDGNGLNNKFTNLRELTCRQNAQNHYSHRKGKLVGASFDKTHQRWRSQITIGPKNIRLGCFNTELEAHERYMQELKTRGLL